MKILKSIHGKEAFVDDKYFDFLDQFRWSVDKGYFVCTNNGTWNNWEIHKQPLHHFVIKLLGHEIPNDLMVDHVNQNPVDNQGYNFRFVTTQMNACNAKIRIDNTSGLRGVSFSKLAKRWRADITLNCKQKYLGCYDSKEEASSVYEEARRVCNLKLFGAKFSHVNSQPLEDLGFPSLTVNIRTRQTREQKIGITGFRGVTVVNSKKNPFHAAIWINGKQKHLGNFKTAELASEAYEIAKINLTNYP